MIYYGIFVKKLISFILIILAVLSLVYVGLYFWPFLIAFIVSLSIEPIIETVSGKTRLNRKLITIILVILVYGLIGLVFSLIIMKLIKESTVLIGLIPDIYEKSVTLFKSTFQKYSSFYDSLPDTITNRILEIGTGLLSKISGFTMGLLNSLFDFLLYLPNLVIHLVVTVVSTYFISTDRVNLVGVIKKVFPETWVTNLFNGFKIVLGSLYKYFKSQIILAAITFIEIVIAFLLIGQKYPFTLAIIIALLDFLPIVGAGSLIIPWAIYSAITGNISFALVLITILGIMMVIRQIIEPKIVSDSLGIKPLTAILFMYLGFKVFGVMGMVFGPILGIIIKDVLNTVLEAGFFENIFIDKKNRMIRYFKKYE